MICFSMNLAKVSAPNSYLNLPPPPMNDPVTPLTHQRHFIHPLLFSSFERLSPLLSSFSLSLFRWRPRANVLKFPRDCRSSSDDGGSKSKRDDDCEGTKREGGRQAGRREAESAPRPPSSLIRRLRIILFFKQRKFSA